MAWGVQVTTDIFISKVHKIKACGLKVATDIFVSKVHKNDVQYKIEENDEEIESLEKQLYMLATANPKDMVSDVAIEDGTILEDISVKIDNILKEYRERLIENCKLRIILENIDYAID